VKDRMGHQSIRIPDHPVFSRAALARIVANDVLDRRRARLR
jgi:hypothetical protein